MSWAFNKISGVTWRKKGNHEADQRKSKTKKICFCQRLLCGAQQCVKCSDNPHLSSDISPPFRLALVNCVPWVWVPFQINSDGIMYPQSQPRTL